MYDAALYSLIAVLGIILGWFSFVVIVRALSLKYSAIICHLVSFLPAVYLLDRGVDLWLVGISVLLVEFWMNAFWVFSDALFEDRMQNYWSELKGL